MRRATFLGLLACVLAAISMTSIQGEDASSPTLLGRALHLDALGAPRPDAPLARRTAPGVDVRIDRRGFEVAGPKTLVSLNGLDTGKAGWARYARGASRRTSFGRETIVVAPQKTEQFLTVDQRQGPKTWRWRLAAGELQPIVGDDGAVGLWSGHALASVHVDPVALLDTAGHDVTPSGLRWSLARDRRGWLLELRVDDAHLPLPYVIDPAITYVAAGGGNNAGGATTLVITKPAGVVENNLLVAQVTVRGGTGIGAITSPGWTSTAPGWATLRQDYTNVNASQTFWKVAGAAEPATYTWSWGATSAKASGGIIALKGVDNAAPVDQFGGSMNGTSTTNILAPSITTQTANTMLIGLFGSTSSPSTNVTPPASMTERYEDASTSGVSTRNEGATEPFAAVGATGTRTATTDQIGSSIGQLIALKLDTTNPTGSVTAPAAAAIVRGNAVTVSSDSADGGSGVANAQFQRSPAGAGVWTNIVAADTTSPYSVAWDTTAVADGLYDLRVVTTDNAANTFTSALITNVRVDNTNPTGAVTAPAASANVRGNAVTVSSNSLDGGSGVANAQFQRSPAGGGVWTNIGAADTTSPYSVAWDTTAVADGLYDLRVITTDNAGNTFTSALITNVRVDNTNPTGSVTAPAASANVTGNAVTVSSNSLDGGSGVANAQFQRSPAGGGVWTNIGAADTTSPYSVAWDTTAVADGLYDLRVITTDNAGNTFTSALITNVRVDNTNPTGAVTAPAASANVRGNAVTVSSDSADGGSGVANAQFQRSPAGGGVWTTISIDNSSPYSIAWDTTAVADGLYDLRVITTDNVGKTFTSALITNVRVDNTNPTGSLTAPASAAIVRGNAVTVSSNSLDGGSGVASAAFQRSPAGVGVWTTISTDNSSPYSIAWDTTAVADGLYDLRVITTDNAGNTFTSGLVTNVRVDNTNPTGSVTAPAASANVTGNAVTVSSNSLDGGSGVANAQFQRSPAGGGTWTNIGAADTTSPYSVAWDTTAVADGLYDLQVITTDNAGNTFTSPLITNVRVDNTNPTGSVTAPASSANVRGAAVTVSSDSADAGSGVANAQFQRSPAGAGVWTNIGAADTTSPYSVAWDTTSLADGLYDLRVITTDNVGKTFTSALVTNVRVDNTNPTGAVTGPASGVTVRGNAVTVTSDSADGGSGVANAQFQRSPAGGGVWTNIGAADTTSPYSVAWDTTAVADGLYDLRVVTTDSAGNTFNSAFVTNVRVDNTNPTGSVTAPAASANVRGAAVTVSSDSADGGSGVANAQFQRSPAGGGVWTNIGAADTTSPYSVAWDTTALADGLYDLRVITTDNVGNTFTSALVTNVRVDNTNPTGSITAPAASANVRGVVVTVSSNSADGGSGVQQADFQRSPAGAGTWTTIATDNSSPYSVAWDTTAVADGLYDLRGVTTDNAGNTFTSALVTNVRVDNTNPTGSITAPAASANVRGAAVTVSSNSADGGSGVQQADFQRSPAGAGTWTTIATDNSSPYSVAWATTAVADGLYDLRVVTTDNAGNSLTSVLVTNVRVDNTNPSGSVTAPAASANVNGAAVTVSSNSADGGSGVANAQFQRSPAGSGVWTNIGAADTTSPYSVAWDTTAVADGLYDLRVVTTDNAGNSLTSVLVTNVRVDNTNPTGSVTAPGAGANVTGNAVPVSSDSADGGSGVASAQFQRSPAGAGVWTTIATDNSSPYSVAWDTTALADGSYDLRLITTDNAGNTFTSAVRTVTVDNSAPAAPALSFDSFTNASATGSTVYYRTGVAGGFTVTGTASDPQSGLDYLTFPGLGSGWTGGGADMSAPYNGVYTFNTSANDPTEPNDVTATNNVGITSSPASFTVTPDSLAPVSSILCDGGTCAGGWYTSAVSVSLSANDGGSGLQEIRFTTDGTDPSPINGSVYATPFSVPATMTVKFRSYDTVGNEEAVASQLVRIDTSAPSAPSLTLSESPASGNQHVSGATLYYNPQGGNSGSFTVDASASDAQSGIEKVTFPALTGMTGGGDDTSSPYQGFYSWTASTTGSGAQTVTARNNAALTSSANFTVTPDTTAPGSQTATLVGGLYYTSASVAFTTGDGSDSGAGLNTSSGLVERASATLSNGTCTGGFSSFGGSYSSPDSSVVSGNCYRYRFTIADNVGNVSIAVVTADAKVDTSAPTGTMGDPGANLRGTVALTSTNGDPESGVATVTYQHSPAGQNTWTANAASWDTTGVADGLYDLRVTVTNNAGTTTNSAIVANRRIDNTAPSASMDDPGSPLSETVTLTSTASDVSGSGLDTATFQYSYQGTGPWTTIGTDSSAPFSVDWDTTAGLDGRYNLRVIASDVAGNSTTSSTVTNRKIQNLPPLVNITAPGNYINAASPSPFTITTTTETPQFAADNVEFFRCTDGSANCSTGIFASIGVDFTSPYTASWAQASEPEGNRTLKAVVTDVDGGTGEDIFNVTIDRTAPTGSITGPGGGAYVGGTTVAVSSDSADTLSGVGQVVFQRSPAGQNIWAAIATDTTLPYSVNWDTTSLSDGAFDLRAVTTDLAGNSFNGPVRTVNVDNTGPTATQDDPGANLRARATLSSSSSDPAGIAQVVFQRSAAGQSTWTPIATDTTFPYSTSFDTTAVADGLYDFRIVATDSVGNPTSSAPVVNRRVDNTSPSATMTSPGANIRATVSLGSTTSDSGSGMASVRYERSPAGQNTWTAIGTSSTSPYSLNFDSTAVGDGLYDLRAVATDVAGNSTTSAAVTGIRVDNTPPDATMNDPGANIGGTIGLTSTTSDGGSGINTVTYQYSQAGQASWTTTPASWNTTLLGDGLYDLRVIATDNAGNSTTSAVVADRRVDNGAPTISISQPGTYVNGSDADPFTVTASSPDTDLANVQFFACDNASANCSAGNWVLLGTDTSAPYSAAWVLPGADGNRALRALATDLASNAGQAIHNVLVDRAAPSGGSVSYLDGYDTTGSLAITTSNGTDSGSGVDAASGVIQRDAVALAAGACDTFAGSWTSVTSPDSVASGNCYAYRYRIADLAGNVATYPSGNVAKVDTSAPSVPSISFSSLTNAVTSGQTVYFRAGVAGGFTVTGSSSDGQSGIASYAFPALGSGWSGSPSGASDAYSFSSSAADPTEPLNVTVQNNAGLTSSPGAFTVTADGTAPVSSIACDSSACSGGWYTSAVSVSLSASDAGSGLQEIRFTTDGTDPSPINGTVYSAPFSVGVTTTVKFRAYDQLGNEESVGSQLVQVDSSAPSAPTLSFGSFQNAVLAGGVIWYRPSASSGQFAVTASSSDSESGIAGYTFPAPATGWSRSISGATATYSHSGSPSNPVEPNDVSAQNNAGLSSAPTSFTADPDGTAPLSSITCDGAACSAGWYTSSVSVSLSASDTESGLAEIRYTTDGSDPGPGNGAVYSGAFSVGTTTTVRYRAYDQLGNEEAIGQQLIRIDGSAPAAPALSLSESPASPNQHVSGTTLYYNPQGSSSGTFTVDAATSDPGSGIDRVSFAALTGMTGGGDDTTSPYQATYDWSSGSSASGAQTVVAHNNAGLTSSATFTVTPDTTAPSGQTIDNDGGPYYTTLSVSLTIANGSDSGSGLDASSGVVERQSATLTSDSCVTWSGWSPVSLVGGADTSVVAGNCYRYRYSISDNVGNQSSPSSTSGTAKIDTSAPSAPTISFSALTNASVSGQTVYFRSGAAGGFTVTADSNDAQSGIDFYAFPTLGPGWSGTTSGAATDYTFSSSASDPAEPNNVTAQNNAGVTSSPSSFTVTPDGTAPASSISCDSAACAGNWYTSSVSVALSASDAASGVQEIRYTTDGSVPGPGNGTVYSTPFSLGATTTVKFRAYDLVGNAESVNTQLVQIDTSAPAAPALTLSESPASAKQYVSGTTLFYNPQGANAGNFTVDAATSDAQSGIDHVAFPALGGMTGGGNDSSSPYQGSYSWTSASGASGAQTVTAHNNAGLTSSASFAVTPDTAPPTGGSVDYVDGYAVGSVTITTADGADALSGVDAASGVIERDTTNLVSGACDPFPGSWSAVTSPDSTISAGHCYQYRYRVSDNVGNNAVYTSTNVVKVSVSAPSAPALTLAEAPSNANQFVAGTTLFYNPTGANSATFTVTAIVADSGGSGIDRISFPALAGMTGGGDDTTSPYLGSYDWNSGSSASGAQTVTVHNNAGLTSSATFTVTPDTAPPTGQSATVTGGYYTSLSVPVTLANGSDALSGVDASSAVLERETATLANGSCVGWSGSWNTVSLTGGADTTVQSNHCYHYRYSISDNVGNQSGPSTSSADAKVDATNPVTGDDAPAGWSNAAVTVTLSVTETGSGVASTVYRVDGGSYQAGTTILIPAPADHSNDGVHTIDYRSTDNAGNAEPLQTTAVRIDTTLPTTTDDAPAGWRDSAVTVTLSPADALSGIASTQYRIDGGSFQSGVSISVPAPADHSNDGVHTIDYRSTDNAGNAEPLQTTAVRIDTQLPSGALTAPVDGAHVNGSVAISASAGDLPSGVASVEFLVRPNGSGSFSTISTDTTAPYDAAWDSTGAAEGDAELEVVVVDNAGLSVTSAIRTVVVDNPPVPTLADPGANLAGSVTLNAASQADTAQVVFERSPAGAGTWTQIATDTSAPFSADFDTTSVGDGHYDFRAVATDLGGFDGTSALRTALVDNTAPGVSVSDPADGAVVGGANVHIAAIASDLGAGVASVRFEQRPAGSGAFTAVGTDTTQPYEASWDATGLSGSYELRAVATDAAGNPATATTVTVTVDTTAASVTLEDPGALLRGVVNLAANAPSGAVASVSFERRPAGGSWTRIALDTTRPWSAAFDTKSVADGVYDLRAQALGGAGQVLATHSRDRISIDNTAPTMLSVTPADGSVVSPVTSIALVASEPVSAVQGATLDGSAAPAQISGSDVTFSTSPLGLGAHTLIGAFVDAAGNRGAFAVHFTVKVKAHAPLILRVDKPKTATRSRGTECVFGVSIFLSGHARVQATLVSPTGRRLRALKTNLSAGRHSLRFIVPTASLPPGRYTILVVATAPDGSKAHKRVYVKVAAAQTTVNTHAENTTISREVVTPVAPSSGPSVVAAAPDSTTPPARTSKPEPKKQPPRAKNGALEAASRYAGSSRPGHTFALAGILLLLGGALAFLIKMELGRMLAPRR